MTKTEFEQFLKNAYAELDAKQDRFIEQSKVKDYAEYWIDIENGKLDFIGGEQDKISFEVTCIGTWSQENGNWMWAWAHDLFPEPIRQRSARLKELQQQTGSPVFAANFFECNEMGAIELTAMAVHHLNAIGMYRIPGEQAHLYVAVMKRVED